jgi:heterodisulfide reductase subunit C
MLHFLPNLIFVALLGVAVYYFTINIRKIIRNINLGQNQDRNDNKAQRWEIMARVAMGQSKMITRPVAGIMHLFVYVGFVLINIEVLEIVIDGIFGTHRILSFMGGFYNFLIGFFEVLALLVLVAVIVFWSRRNVVKVKRFSGTEMKGWALTDANNILYIEIVLMTAVLMMNGADHALQLAGAEHYTQAGSFPISSLFFGWMEGMNPTVLMAIERVCWWLHIVGIFLFLNYLPISKHLHILLAFPNVWYSNLAAKGKFKNNGDITREVNLMLDPSATIDPNAAAPKFGARDVNDLSWIQLMNAYSCTECGRCTSSCPANQTGKLLSPRKIMMDTRDRLEEVGKNIDTKGIEFNDGKSLVGDYITAEELWACTSCNACVEACPVNIDPLSIIMDLRQYLVLEKSEAPQSLNGMFTNIENNGAPWQYSQADRLKWANE